MATALALHGTLACAEAVEIPLGTPDGFSANRIDATGGGRYCISGSVYDDSGPSWSAMVVMVDAQSGRVLWRTPIPYAPDHVSNSPKACGSDGHSIYAVTEESTQSAATLNQNVVVLNRISATGKLEKQQRLSVGFDEWSWLFSVGANGITIAGGTSGTTQMGGPFGTYVAQFNADLTQTGVKRLPSGAFGNDASASLDGDRLLVAGSFLPNEGEGHDGYAVSKVDIDKKRYLWSTYALPDAKLTTSALLAGDGTIYVAGSAPSGALTITTIDRTGKIASTFTTKSKAFCHLKTALASGHTLKVFGNSCKDDATTELLSVDLASHAVSPVHAFHTELQAGGFDGNNWIGVAKTQAHGLAFVRGSE
ncbi:hypothetical protein [Paraburkholderia sp. J67]|uniref:hypothetical protein n=1 Tax=Paraburkholderia sp. J67 TaxID=2805435 RepID=UPI002ABE7A96|nr:hypothetical protein [Paraburkholderia sp. J67]